MASSETLSVAAVDGFMPRDGDPVTGSAVSISAVSWAAVAAGGVASAALSLILLAFGVGMGFSAVSPWSNSGITSTNFNVIGGIYLIVIAVLSSSVGGYLAGRLRTKWTGVHTHEVYFRDTAHGFLAWAFGTLISAAVLASAGSAIAGDTFRQAPRTDLMSEPAAYYVDALLRPEAPTTATSDPTIRDEAARILERGLAQGTDVSSMDRAYLGQVVSRHTGLGQPEAERRVSDVLVAARRDTDVTRRAITRFSFWLAASMLVGAFAASLAATEGGELRDRI